MNYIFSPEEFYILVFSVKPFDKDFLKKWNNIGCVAYHVLPLTPVEWAASHDYLDVVKFLVENGADITLDGNWTIYAAMYDCSINVVKYLLSTNIYSKDCVQELIDEAYDPKIIELLTNYKQFSKH